MAVGVALDVPVGLPLGLLLGVAGGIDALADGVALPLEAGDTTRAAVAEPSAAAVWVEEPEGEGNAVGDAVCEAVAVLDCEALPLREGAAVLEPLLLSEGVVDDDTVSDDDGVPAGDRLGLRLGRRLAVAVPLLLLVDVTLDVGDKVALAVGEPLGVALRDPAWEGVTDAVSVALRDGERLADGEALGVLVVLVVDDGVPLKLAGDDGVPLGVTLTEGHGGILAPGIRGCHTPSPAQICV